MSSENMSSETGDPVVEKKVAFNAHVKIRELVHFMLTEEAQREQRSVSYLISKIVEDYYEKKSSPRIL